MENRIDPAKLRAAIRHMPKDGVYHLLDRAVGLLSQKGLRRLIKGFPWKSARFEGQEHLTREPALALRWRHERVPSLLEFQSPGAGGKWRMGRTEWKGPSR